jgi:hypothetical protein
MTDQLVMFGEFDGEAIEVVGVKLSGAGVLDRKLIEGERVVLMITGVASLPQIQRVNGLLVRLHTVKAEKVAEPVEELADEVERFIQAVDDRRKGQEQLPVDGDDDEDPDDA